jgi:hypothetical protein
VDSDGDGLSDWEELQVGLDPIRVKTDTLGQEDLLAMQALLAADNLVAVKAQAAVSNITRMEDGAFELTRTGGLDALTVSYTVSGTAAAGSDYVSLSGAVIIPFGENSVIIPVTPIAGSSMALSESVVLTILNVGTYSLGLKFAQQVNVLKEVAINVKDHGAVGDGTTDDTVAIRAALYALEVSTTHNTLYFPQGTYRLNQYITDHYTKTSQWRILTFGYRDMTGRDIIFSGDVDSSLYSTVSPTRAHMMVVISTFRSLTCRGMTWQKDSVPLSEKAGSEPSGADGVSLLARDSRIVEHVNFHGCKFLNCHGALMITANGYDRRGHLRQLGFYQCELLNPFGSNTINIRSAWGGGQQTYLSQWVGDAIYKENLFEGGGPDMTDETTSPGGSFKDAAMIGSPQRLIFQNNVVRYMGVEAVFHNGRERWMNQPKTAIVVPAADGNSSVTVEVFDLPTTFVPGQSILLRTQTTETAAGKNNVFRVTVYDATSQNLTFVNDGHPGNADPGSSIARYGDIYLNDSAPRNKSIITDNLMEGYLSPGTFEDAYNTAFTINTLADVRRNVIKGFVVGVMTYDDDAPYPNSKGLRVASNIILTRDTTVSLPFGVMGIRSWAPQQEILNNIVIAPLSRKFAGISAYGNGALVQDNWVIAMNIERHDYTSPIRALGVGLGNSATDTVFEGNHTFGFDVGCGPLGSGQSVPHRVISHHSVQDTLPIDPRGVIAE